MVQALPTSYIFGIVPRRDLALLARSTRLVSCQLLVVGCQWFVAQPEGNCLL